MCIYVMKIYFYTMLSNFEVFIKSKNQFQSEWFDSACCDFLFQLFVIYCHVRWMCSVNIIYIYIYDWIFTLCKMLICFLGYGHITGNKKINITKGN